VTRRPPPAVRAAKVERWLSDEEHATTASAIFARKLATREPVNVAAFMHGLDRSYSAGSLVIGDMRMAGYRIKSNAGIAQVTGYTVPARRDLSQNGNGSKPRHKPPMPVEAPRAPQAHPTVGGVLMVRAVVLNDAGTLEIMGVDENGHAWQLAIVGTA
jgi:hypothetical protein